MPRRRNNSEKSIETVTKVEETKEEVKEVKKEETKKPSKVIAKTFNKKIIVNALNFRDKPDGNILKVLHKGQILETKKCDEVWDEVVGIDGKEASGYVMSKFLMEMI